jgi:hypothetical protein
MCSDLFRDATQGRIGPHLNDRGTISKGGSNMAIPTKDSALAA